MGVAGAGGLGASGRRPDQHYGAPAGGLVPGSRTGIVRARQVIVFGTGNGVGLFEYNGTPALGNPPVAYAAPPGVTQDPYGNLLPSTAGGFTVLGSVGRLTVMSLNGNSLAFQNQTAQPASQALMSGFGSTSGTELLLASGKGTVGAQGVVATLLDSLQSAQATAQLVLNPGIAAAAPLTTALLEVQGQISTTGFNKVTAGGDLEAIFGNVHVIAAGSGLRVAEGANAKQGVATLAAGTKLVANTSVTASSRIGLTAQDNNSTGALRVSARVAGTSFTITSSNAADSGVVAWWIFEPG